MEEQLLNIINTVLKNRGKNTISIIKKNTNIRKDIDFDSLDLAELTVRIEADFNVDVFEDGIVNTVGEIIQKIKNKK